MFPCCCFQKTEAARKLLSLCSPTAAKIAARREGKGRGEQGVWVGEGESEQGRGEEWEGRVLRDDHSGSAKDDTERPLHRRTQRGGLERDQDVPICFVRGGGTQARRLARRSAR